MADLTSSTVGSTTFGVNFNVAKAGNGIAGKTRILGLAKSNMTQTELNNVIRLLQAGGTAGTDDAVTVVGISVLTESGVFTTGVTDAVQVAVQGTGVLTAGADYRGVTGVTMSVIADFAGLQVA
jgi:hypothetical protein